MNKKIIRLTESDLHRIVKESVKRVLNEGMKSVDPNNVVPEDLAIQYGFEPEYSDSENGLELWGKDLTGDYNKLLFKLGIRDFTSISNSITGKHVRITVKPNQRKNNDSMQIPRKIGDYINSEYGDDKGTIFNNPKNGHTRRLNKFGKFI